MKLSTLPMCIILATTGVGCASRPHPTLCEIADNREKYTGQEVTIEGVLWVTYHGISINEPKCERAIAINWPDKVVPRMRELDSIAARSETETIFARVRVTGLVKRSARPDWVGLPHWYVDLTGAKVLESYPINEIDKQRFMKWRNGPSPEPFRPSS